MTARSHRPGFGSTDRVRLSDVARMAGVSTTTASRALNGRGEMADDTRHAVLEAARRLGFRPSPFAQSLRSRHSTSVGLIVPHVDHPFYASLVKGAQSALRQEGYHLILMDTGEDPGSVAKAIDTLLDHWVDGMMIATTPLSAAHFADLLRETPSIFIDEMIEGVGQGAVTLENQRGIELLVAHLADDHGHRSIGFVGGPPDETDGRERREGFLAAIAERNLSIDPAFVRDGEWSIASGATETLALLGQPVRPTALIAASAELALGALGAARSLGLRLPEELALVAFDDPYFAPLLEPALTAVSYDAPEMGSRSARLLLDAIRNETTEYVHMRVSVELIRRHSCGCEFAIMPALAANG
jgi:DNA-binding LacI/PurR family transcriptional regulator